MTPAIIAQVLEEVIYAGRPKSNEMRLDYDDCLQLTYLASAAIMRARFKEDMLLNMDLGLGDLIVSYELSLSTDKFNRKVADLPVEVMNLPNDAGIFSVTPLAGDGSLVQCKPVVRMPAGAEWLYCNDFDGPFSYFTRYKNQIVFYLLDPCITKVLVNVVSNSEDAPIPDDIGWEIFKQVYAQIARTYAIPIDKRMDGNPNAEEIFLTKLTAPQPNR